MKTFPINLCRRELSTFPLSPAKDAVFLCDELVKDYPAEMFGFEVNPQHYSRIGLEMDLGWAGRASRAVQDTECNPSILIWMAKPAQGVPRKTTKGLFGQSVQPLNPHLDGKATQGVPRRAPQGLFGQSAGLSVCHPLFLGVAGAAPTLPLDQNLLAQTISVGFWPHCQLCKTGPFSGRFLAP